MAADTYKLNQKVVDLCEATAWPSFGALRLFHGIMFTLDKLTHGNQAFLALPNRPPDDVRSKAIERAVGPRKTHDHRQLRAAIDDLAATGLMKVLTLHPSGRVLTLQLGQRVAK